MKGLVLILGSMTAAFVLAGCASGPAVETGQGEFIIVGEVIRPGLYNQTGRKVTTKMCVSAAGWPNSDPQYGVLVRGVNKSFPELMEFNIQEIFAENSPEILIQSGDVIYIGKRKAELSLSEVRREARRVLDKVKEQAAASQPAK